MSIKVQNTPNRAAFDVQSSYDIRAQFQKDPKAGLQAAAQQFEALFMQMVMKSMRDATPQDGLLNSDQSRFYTSLLDQQMAQHLASTGKGVGFARLIEQQLGGQMGGGGKGLPEVPAKATGNDLPLATTQTQHLQYQTVPSRLPTSADYARMNSSPSVSAAEPAGGSREFVNRVWPHAVEASRSTGIPPQFLVAQSALESGWGRGELRKADGSPSFNLFGIKAGASWQGATVDATTTEYVNGEPQKMVERFRAYGSYEEAFRDYAALLRNNPRYSGVIGSQDGTEFARRLQQAGYATDPMYADKLSRIINGAALRQALIG